MLHSAVLNGPLLETTSQVTFETLTSRETTLFAISKPGYFSKSVSSLLK